MAVELSINDLKKLVKNFEKTASTDESKEVSESLNPNSETAKREATKKLTVFQIIDSMQQMLLILNILIAKRAKLEELLEEYKLEQEKLKSAHTDNNDLNDNSKALQALISDLRKQLDSLDKHISALNSQVAQLQAQLTTLQAQRAGVQHQIQQQQTALQQIQTNINNAIQLMGVPAAVSIPIFQVNANSASTAPVAGQANNLLSQPVLRPQVKTSKNQMQNASNSSVRIMQNLGSNQSSVSLQDWEHQLVYVLRNLDTLSRKDREIEFQCKQIDFQLNPIIALLTHSTQQKDRLLKLLNDSMGNQVNDRSFPNSLQIRLNPLGQSGK